MVALTTSQTFMKAAVAAALAGITVLIYGQVIRFDFLNYDDRVYVLENDYVRQGFTTESVTWAFTTFDAGLWAPLARMSHMADYVCFGAWAGGHHFTSVLLHALNTVLLLFFLARATRSFWPSALVAALFAWHPLHVESVAWIAARKDVLSTFFTLLALFAYDGYVHKPGPLRLGAVAFWLALGLLSKPMVVTVPFVLLLLDVWPYARLDLGLPPREIARSLGRLVLEKAPLFALAGACCVLTVLAEEEAIVPLERLSVLRRIGHALVAYGAYLGKTIYPRPLAIPYTFGPWFFSPWKVAGVAALLAAITTAALVLRRRAAYLLVGWLWFLGVLVPVIGFVQIGHHALADRFTYVPLIGLFIALAWGLAALAGRWPSARLPIAALAAAGLVALLTLSFVQIRYWQNSGTLFSHSLAVTRNNYAAHCNLGNYLMEVGRPEAAIPHFERACAIEPGSTDALNDLGVAYLVSGKLSPASATLAKVAARTPNDAEARVNYGAALYALGDAAGARSQALAALDLDPHLEKARQLLQLLEGGSRE